MASVKHIAAPVSVAEYVSLKSKHDQMVRGITPFMQHCQRMYRELAEFRQMERDLRCLLQRQEDDDDAYVSCSGCECPLNSHGTMHAIQCMACKGVNNVCYECCHYPLAHGWE